MNLKWFFASFPPATVKDGGAAPQWGFGSGEALVFDLQAAAVPECEIKVFDEDVGSKDDFIGSYALLPGLMACPADMAWSRDEWVELKNRRGKPAGQLHLILQWNPAPETTGVESRSLSVLVFGGRNLEHEPIGRASAMPTVKPYVTVSALTKSLQTVAVNPSGDTVSWGMERLKSERLAFLHHLLTLPRDDAGHLLADNGEPALAMPLVKRRESSGPVEEDLWDFALHFGVDAEEEPYLLAHNLVPPQ